MSLLAPGVTGNDKELGEYSAITDKIAELKKAEKELSSTLPDRTGYELASDPFYAKDYAKLQQMEENEKALQASASKLEKLYLEFRTCKGKERIQVSLKKSGQRLTDQNRAKLKELRDLLRWWDSSAPASELIAKALPEREVGQQSAQELRDRERRLAAMGTELRGELPAAHLEFLAAAKE